MLVAATEALTSDMPSALLAEFASAGSRPTSAGTRFVVAPMTDEEAFSMGLGPGASAAPPKLASASNSTQNDSGKVLLEGCARYFRRNSLARLEQEGSFTESRRSVPRMQIADVIDAVMMAIAMAMGWALMSWSRNRGEIPTAFAATCMRPNRVWTTL